MNPYRILKVKKKATQQEIKKAYHELAKKYHPDKENGNEEKFKKISEAYSILSNPEKRKYFDAFGFTNDSKMAKTSEIVIINFRNYIISAIESRTFKIEEVANKLNGEINHKKEDIKNIELRKKDLDYLSECVEVKKKRTKNLFQISLDQLTEELEDGIKSKQHEIDQLKECIKIAKNYKTIKNFRRNISRMPNDTEYTLRFIGNL